MNVRGLKRRLYYPEFINDLLNFDILCLAETNIDCYDEIEIPNYVFYSKCRDKFISRKSGGIGVFIKKSIAKHIIEIQSNSEYILWLKLSGTMFSKDDGIILGTVYMPLKDPTTLKKLN